MSKQKSKPYRGKNHPKWGQLIKTAVRFVTGSSVDKKGVVTTGPVLKLEIARAWRRPDGVTVTYYTVKTSGKRRVSAEKVHKKRQT